jgi:hypothetical protein
MLPCPAEATSKKISEAVDAAGEQGFSAQQSLQAAVDTLSSAASSAADPESLEAKHLRLLVRTDVMRCSACTARRLPGVFVCVAV